MIHTKDLINTQMIDLNPILNPDKKVNKNYQLKQFKTLDVLASPVLFLHNYLIKMKYLMAVHAKRPSDVFIATGGFKNMYPLIDRICSSNLLEIGRSKPSLALLWIFRILQSLMN